MLLLIRAYFVNISHADEFGAVLLLQGLQG